MAHSTETVEALGAAADVPPDPSSKRSVDIHVLQEPDHVEQVNEAIEPDFTPGEIDRIVASAEEMWSLWIAFFDRLRQVMFGAGAAEPVAVATA